MLLRKLALLSVVGSAIVLQFRMSPQSFLDFPPDTIVHDAVFISPNYANTSLDPHPSDAQSRLPEHYWTALDVEKFVPAALRDTPLVYFVTPTYYNRAQWVNMVRLSQTLMNDKLIYWIVVEDAKNCSLRIRKQLDFTGMMYAHLATETPKTERKKSKGTFQRNRAIEHVQSLNGPDGVVYFGDDDNAYDLRLFRELRKTRRVSIFSIAFVGGGMYERCVVDPSTGKVNRTATNWAAKRKFPIDMGGFAIHTSVIKSKKPRFRNRALGFMENDFLGQIAGSLAELEPLNSNCTRIYSWHLKTGGTIDTRVQGDPAFQEIKGVV